jgi:hypothetical protein
MASLWPLVWLVAIMGTYDRAPKFDVNWRIIDWTALTDKANGNALKDANAYFVESFLNKANLQVMPKAPRHGYD